MEERMYEALEEEFKSLKRRYDELEESERAKTEEIRRLHTVCRELRGEDESGENASVESMTLNQYAMIIMSEVDNVALGESSRVLQCSYIDAEQLVDLPAAAFIDDRFVAYPVRESDGRLGVECRLLHDCANGLVREKTILHLVTGYKDAIVLPAIGSVCALLMYVEDQLHRQGWRRKSMKERPDPIGEAINSLYRFGEGEHEA